MSNLLYSFMYNDRMDSISYTEARATLASAMDKVCDRHDPLVITRQGRKSVVLISLEDYEALDETAYLKRSPKNARRLTRSIRRLESGTAIDVELADLAG